jgi:hypothetical protein
LLNTYFQFTSFLTADDNILEGDFMAKYGKAVGKYVEKAMHELKVGKLKSGRSNKRVRNPKQAIAIGLSEAREKGSKVPKL